MSQDVLTEIRDGVGIITLNRPQSLNALSDDMTKGLTDATAAFERDDAVRCVLLRGAGDHFMAGGDVKGFYERLKSDQKAHAAGLEWKVNLLHALIYSFRRMNKPTVVSVQGAAAGFGLSLMMAADLAIVADDAFFTLAYANIGFSADGGATYWLPRLVGTRKALEIAYLAERFDAKKAQELGIVNFVVPRAQLEAETEKLTRRLASGPTFAYGEVKRLMHNSLESNFDSQLHREAEAIARCAASADHLEGVTAFVEKRKPVFKGR
jgi:2-(1,2-epoxy-1,2-dihydrophenyl)acetyl-CoA isomerase